MNFSKTLSVIIPVGKMAGRLEKLEVSLKSTQNKNIEWIIVHDHFDDLTCTELDNLIKKCNLKGNMIRLETEIRGVGNARNTGLLAANGDWVCFIDSDDEALVDQYWNMMLLAEKNHKNFAIGEYLRKDENKVTQIENCKYQSKSNRYILEVSKNPGLWRWVIRSKRLEGTIFDNVPMGEDLLFIKKLNPRMDEILPFPKSVYTYYSGIQGQATNDNKALSFIPSSFRIALEIDQGAKKQHYLSRQITFRLGLSTLKRKPTLFVLRALATDFISGKFKVVDK